MAKMDPVWRGPQDHLEAICGDQKAGVERAMTLTLLGRLQRSTGQEQKAMATYRQAEEAWAALPDGPEVERGRARNLADQVLPLRQQGDLKRARRCGPSCCGVVGEDRQGHPRQDE